MELSRKKGGRYNRGESKKKVTTLPSLDQVLKDVETQIQGVGSPKI